jgi:tetratricopeptide (TPR) repeat protein
MDLTPLDTPDPDLSYIFKHGVTQEVAYETLAFETRAKLHELLAQYIEINYSNEPPLEALAYHYCQTENLPKKREYLQRSADAAFAVYSNETALNYYQQVLASTPRPEEAVDLHLKIGEILFLVGKRSEARSEYEEAVQVAVSNKSTEKIIESQLKYATSLDEYKPALGILNKTYQLALELGDPEKICDCLTSISQIEWRLGKLDLGLDHSQQSLELAITLNDRKRQASSLYFMASLYTDRGEYSKAHEYFKKTLDIQREMNDTRRIAASLLNWGSTYYFEGNYKAAQNCLSESIECYHQIGDKRSSAIVLNNLGNIIYLTGDYPGAENYYKQALKIGDEADDLYIKSIALPSLGITAFQQGNFDEAESYYEVGMTINRTMNQARLISLLYCYQGLLAHARGQNSHARRSFLAGLKLAYESDIKTYIVYNLVGCALIALAEGQDINSVTVLGSVSAIATSIGMVMETEIKQPFEKAVSELKLNLAEDEFESSWEAGKVMTTEQAYQFALQG